MKNKIKISKQEFDDIYEIEKIEDVPQDTPNIEEEQEEQFLTEEEMEHDKRFHQDDEKEPSEGTDK